MYHNMISVFSSLNLLCRISPTVFRVGNLQIMMYLYFTVQLDAKIAQRAIWEWTHPSVVHKAVWHVDQVCKNYILYLVYGLV